MVFDFQAAALHDGDVQLIGLSLVFIGVGLIAVHGFVALGVRAGLEIVLWLLAEGLDLCHRAVEAELQVDLRRRK